MLLVHAPIDGMKDGPASGPKKKKLGDSIYLSGPAGAVVPVVTVIVTDVPINGFHAIALRKQELHL